MTLRTCPSCGARTPDAAARFCARCGTPLSPEEDPAAAEDALDGPARLAALRERPELADLMQRVPALGRRGGAGALVAGAGLIAGGGLLLLIPALAFPPLAVAVAVLAAIALIVLVGAEAGARRARRGEWVRVPALVVGERTAVGGAAAGAVATRYHVRLQSERGTREEYEVEPEVASKLAPGDVGVAYFKGGLLVDFERVPAQ